MTPRLSTPLSKQQAAGGGGMSMGTGGLSESIQKYFQGYSYVSPFVDRRQWHKEDGMMDDVVEVVEQTEKEVQDTKGPCVDVNDVLDFEMEE